LTGAACWSTVAIDRRTPVLVITRSVDISSYLDAMHLGAIDYVEEPLNPLTSSG